MSLWQDQTSRRGRAAADAQAETAEADARPGSRRAAREAERRAADKLSVGQEHPSGIVEFNGAPLTEQDANRIGVHDTADIWEALSRRAVEPSGDEDQPTDGGRRSRRAPAAPPAPTPVQSRPSIPAFDTPVRAQVPEAPVQDAGPSAQAANAALLNRVRDAVRERHVEEAPRPMTRRELRERAEAQGQAVAAAPVAAPARAAQPFVPQQVAPQAPERFVPDAIQDIPAAFAAPKFPGYVDASTVQMSAIDRAEMEAATVAQHHLAAEPIGDDDLEFSDAYEPYRLPSQPVPTVRVQAQPIAVDPTFLEPPLDTDVTDLRGFEALISRSRNDAPVPAPQPLPQRATEAPTAYWEPEPEEPLNDFLLSRNIGSSHGTQNALIMPSDPQPDLTQAVNGTGDLFITGSMALPRSLATTGATAEHYDSVEIDRLFEAAQDEPASGVAPVRASKAVSGSTRNAVVAPRRGRGGVMPMVLAGIAGFMALGVIALLIGSRVLGLF